MEAYPGEQMQEEGQVVEVRGGVALVEAVQNDACASCGARNACHALGGERRRVVRALNPVGAAVGDRVLMSMPRRAVLGASFLVYMVPVLALLAGAVTGQHLGPAWGLSPTSGAVSLGLGALAAAWLGLRIVSRNLGRRESFQVKIVRVVQKGEVDAVEQHSAGL